MCSETSEAVGTTWEHAQLEFQKFLKIRILLADNLLRHLEKGVDELEANMGDMGGHLPCV